MFTYILTQQLTIKMQRDWMRESTPACSSEKLKYDEYRRTYFKHISIYIENACTLTDLSKKKQLKLKANCCRFLIGRVYV